MEPVTRQCPYLGRYDAVFASRPRDHHQQQFYHQQRQQHQMQQNHGLNIDNAISGQINNGGNVAEVRTATLPTLKYPPTRCHQANIDGLDIGCTKPDLMEFATDCSDKALFSKLSPCDAIALFLLLLRSTFSLFSDKMTIFHPPLFCLSFFWKQKKKVMIGSNFETSKSKNTIF